MEEKMDSDVEHELETAVHGLGARVEGFGVVELWLGG